MQLNCDTFATNSVTIIALCDLTVEEEMRLLDVVRTMRTQYVFGSCIPETWCRMKTADDEICRHPFQPAPGSLEFYEL